MDARTFNFADDEQATDNHATIKQALFRYLDSQPERQISAWQLHDAMYLLTGRKTMPATLLQYAREYADLSGSVFRCFDSRTSTYQFTPGVKIAGAIMGGNE